MKIDCHPGFGADVKANVRPIQGGTLLDGRIPHGPGFNRRWRALRRCLHCQLRSPDRKQHPAPGVRFLRHRGIYLSDVGWKHPSLDRSHSLPPVAPEPSSRRCREEHLLLIVQMSSNRLFLDRVARQQSPSPLHRLIAIVIEEVLEVEKIPANGNQCQFVVSHLRGTPHYPCESV